MTMILSLITRSYVLQVCDRQLTSFDGLVKEDDATKAVLWGNHTAFCYTGLAQLRRSPKVKDGQGDGSAVPTNLWLAEVLKLGGRVVDALRLLGEEGQLAVDHSPAPPEHRSMAFVGVGYMNFAKGDPLQPAVYVASNMNNTGRFVTEVRTLDSGTDFYWLSTQPLSRDRRRQLDRAIKKTVLRRISPSPAARLLLATLREEAGRNPFVGEGVLQICLPLDQASQSLESWTFSAGDPGLNHVTFRHIPAGSDDGLQHGPTVLLGDGTILGQLTLGQGNKVQVGPTSS